MNSFQFSGIAGWVIITCVMLVLTFAVIVGCLAFCWVLYYYWCELLYKFKVARRDRKYFWGFLRNYEEIKRWLDNKNAPPLS